MCASDDAPGAPIYHQEMELAQIEAFLVLAEELHFGRAAERVYLSPSRVSRLVSSLEREIGGRLFERTSRTVSLTPLGQSLREQTEPAYAQLLAAFRAARRRVAGISGQLRLGCTVTTNVPAVSRLLECFRTVHPECEPVLSEVDMLDPYCALRSGDIDILVNWLAADEPDLVLGPVIEERRRALAVGRSHRLAARSSVSIEDVALEQVGLFDLPYPRALRDAFCPPVTPAGRPIDRTRATHSISEALDLIARREIVHITVESVSVVARDDIVLIPVSDLPPLPLGLIWVRAAEHERIRTMADLARQLTPRSGSLVAARCRPVPGSVVAARRSPQPFG
jgi:DNA-binding transcriptional LysR family regulator